MVVMALLLCAGCGGSGDPATTRDSQPWKFRIRYARGRIWHVIVPVHARVPLVLSLPQIRPH